MFLIALLSSQSHALQQDLPPERLFAAAELVVTGEVTSTESRWAAGPEGYVETVVWLAVDTVEKGASVDTVEIRLDGGAIGMHRTVASDAPKLVEDARYRVMLVHDGSSWRVLGGERGPELLSALPLAWELTGNSWAWQERPVEDGFVLNTSTFPLPAAEVGAAWTLALDLWNLESGAPLYLPNDGTTTNAVYGGGDNGLNVTMYDDFDWGSALASAVYNSVGDEMIDCDIRIYGANFNGSIDWSTDPAGAPPGWYDLTHTMIHELGHCLGLSHSDSADAIMYPWNGDGTGWERRHLHADDLGGIHHLYGTAELELLVSVEATADEVQVTVENPSDAPAVDAVLAFEGELLDLGDLPPLAVAEATFALPALEDCTETTLEAVVEDAGERVFSGETVVVTDCAEAPTGPGAEAPSGGGGGQPGTIEATNAGCGCRTGAGAGGWLLLVPLLLLRFSARRR